MLHFRIYSKTNINFAIAESGENLKFFFRNITNKHILKFILITDKIPNSGKFLLLVRVE